MEITSTGGVSAKSVATTPLNLLSQANEGFEIPCGGRRWRLNLYCATQDITVKIYVRASTSNANCGLAELSALRTTVTAGAEPVTISGEGEMALTLKVMGYTASGTAAVDAAMIVGS